MDQMEDFEFKPITEGLGFHRKANKIKQEIKESSFVEDTLSRPLPPEPRSPDADSTPYSRSASQSLNDLMASLPSSIDFEAPPETPPISSRMTTSQSLDMPFDMPLESTREMPSLMHSKKLTHLPAEMPLNMPKDSTDTWGNQNSSHPFDESLAREKSEDRIFQPLPRKAVEDLVDSQATSRQAPVRQLSTEFEAKMSNPTTPASKVSTHISTNFSHQRPAAASPVSKKSLDASLEKAFPKRDLMRTRTAEEFHQEAAKVFAGLHPVSQGIPSSMIDAIVIGGLSLICMVLLSFILKIDMMRLLFDPRTSSTAGLQLLVLFGGTTQIYMLTSRSLFGMTLGEWAFDLQLGKPQQQISVKYPILVMWRTFLVTITGFILIPLLSLIFKKDLFSYVTGLQLYKKR